ncbi:hypothetical protein FBZ94_110230 [Bradyrhizobium sacchari]|uniref:Uncharacterized protein n=1 Tax=Bradyrhizobium sacchari TaxID=1399419 RepID=A0A560JJQ0_9BRAD|nr:hypothetical protein FBZ94_110230 [Bradyrhizobium sacchari]TWB69634.1 hypothetical protein FBZ95_109231 [Bradyrhizobium sacchari]
MLRLKAPIGRKSSASIRIANRPAHALHSILISPARIGWRTRVTAICFAGRGQTVNIPSVVRMREYLSRDRADASRGAPEAFPSVVPVVRVTPASRINARRSLFLTFHGTASRKRPTAGMPSCEFGGTRHHLWCRSHPDLVGYSAELPLGADYEIRAYASQCLWRAIDGLSSAFATAPGATGVGLACARRAHGWRLLPCYR